MIQSLDSLWYFSNSLSGARRILGPLVDHEKPAETEPTGTIEGEAQLESSEQGPWDECSGGEELAEEMAEEEISSSGGGGVRMRRRRRKTEGKRGSSEQRGRKVLGELDVGFNGWRRDQHLWLVVDEMPPLSDRIAMKEHLKYWAHAVACSVR